MDKILRIDVGAAGGPKATTVPIGDYAGLGGRAMTSAIVSKEVPPLCHPLGADNKLIIAPGLLSGSAGAMTGRISVGCKSPLTGGIKEANSGGQAAQVLARLGYAAIVLEGKPSGDDLYKIFINKDGVKITKDNSLRMLPNYDLVEQMKKEHGDKIACISIGPAGEMKMAAASVAFTDMELRPTRHAGRGGVGAVMGAKNVKVIVLDDTGMPMRAPKDIGEVPRGEQEVGRGAQEAPRHRAGPPGLRHQRADEHPERGRRLPHQQLHDGPLRRRREDQRRDPGGDREEARGESNPRLPPRLRHPVLGHLQRQGREVPHQAAGVRDRSGRTAGTAASATWTRSR